MTATAVNPAHFRRVLGNHPTGVTVITAIDAEGEPAGMVVGTFTSVSLSPPLVAFLPSEDSTSWPRIRAAGAFCANVLSSQQQDECVRFARPGGDKFAGLAWRAAPSGSPMLDGVVAWVDCTIEQVTQCGDHYLVLGSVQALDVETDADPLVFVRGTLGAAFAAAV